MSIFEVAAGQFIVLIEILIMVGILIAVVAPKFGEKVLTFIFGETDDEEYEEYEDEEYEEDEY